MTQLRQIRRWVPVCSHEYIRILLFFLFLYLVCSQIWQNYFVNDRHFGYITKSLKETLDCNNTVKYPQTDSDRFGLHWLYFGTGSFQICCQDIHWWQHAPQNRGKFGEFFLRKKKHFARNLRPCVAICPFFRPPPKKELVHITQRYGGITLKKF